MPNANLLRELREKTGCVGFSDREFWTSPHFPPGIAKGIVAELLGNARTEWLLEVFKKHPDLFIFWCEHEPQANPTAIHQRGVALERIRFVNSIGDFQQPLRLALESGHYPFIIAPNRFAKKDQVRLFQRFQLLAEKTKSTLFLLADKEFSSAWPIALQLEINFSDQGFQISVQRQKHGVQQ